MFWREAKAIRKLQCQTHGVSEIIHYIGKSIQVHQRCVGVDFIRLVRMNNSGSRCMWMCTYFKLQRCVAAACG